jgi:PAS domain-containing protein
MTGLSNGGVAPHAEAREIQLEAVYEVVDLIYQAVEEPARLAAALGALAGIAGVGEAVLVQARGGERRVLAEGHSDHVSHHGERSPENGPPGTRTVPLCGGYELVLDRTQLEPARLAAVVRLAPHLSRALRLAERVGHEALRRVVHAAHLDRLSAGVALLAPGGEVTYLNPAARRVLARAGAALALVERRLVVSNPVSRALFEATLERLEVWPRSERRTRGCRLALWDDVRLAAELLAAPFDEPLERGQARTILFLSAPEIAPTIEEIFTQMEGLTSRQARIVVQLLAGREPEEGGELDAEVVAEEVKTLFERLGTTRQRDLVRRVLRVPGELFVAAPRRD